MYVLYTILCMSQINNNNNIFPLKTVFKNPQKFHTKDEKKHTYK